MNTSQYLVKLNQLKNKENKTQHDLDMIRHIERLLYHRQHLREVFIDDTERLLQNDYVDRSR